MRRPLATLIRTQSGADLRTLTPDELEKLGQDSLREHLLAQAVVAHQKYAPITFETLDALLHDSDCLRFPVRLIYEFGEMAMHQFKHDHNVVTTTIEDKATMISKKLDTVRG